MRTRLEPCKSGPNISATTMFPLAPARPSALTRPAGASGLAEQPRTFGNKWMRKESTRRSIVCASDPVITAGRERANDRRTGDRRWSAHHSVDPRGTFLACDCRQRVQRGFGIAQRIAWTVECPLSWQGTLVVGKWPERGG